MAVAAIIVGGDDELVSKTRASLEDSSVPLFEITQVYSLAEFSPNELRQQPADWVWLLEAGMQPEPTALAALIARAETAPSAACLVPKLVKSDKPREIEQFGLTATVTWKPLSPARNEFDQGQQDDKEDLLAGSIFGSLFRVGALSTAWPAHLSRRQLTNDFQVALALRLGGYRVLAAAEAKVRVSAEASSFERANALSRRKTQIELIASHLNPVLTSLMALCAPLVSLLSVLWLLLVKRPERVIPTVFAGFWWFFSLPQLLWRRPKLTKEQRAGLPALRSLKASREELQRLAFDGLETQTAVAESGAGSASVANGFVASGGPWIMLLLAALSFRFWPQGGSVTGDYLLPLGDSLAHLFSRAGSSWQNSGLGLAAPSDPFNWVLFALGLCTFWAPNLSVATFLFLLKPLAFASAWRLLSLVSKRGWLISLGALAYAFWPSVTFSQTSGLLGPSIALVLLPLFLFTLARILQFGSVSKRSVQTWTWVGSGGLLAAAISAAAPSLTPFVAVSIALLAIYRFRRIGYLIWLPIPVIVIFAPYAWYLTAKVGHPLMVLSDPGIPAASDLMSPLQALLGGTAISGGPLPTWFSVVLQYGLSVPLIVALIGTLTTRALNAMWLWLLAIGALAAALIFNRIDFNNQNSLTDEGAAALHNGNPIPLLGLAGLVIAVLLVLTLDRAPKVVSGIGQAALSVFVLVFAGQLVIAPTPLVWTDGSVTPALVKAQSEIDPKTRVLTIRSLASANGASNFDAAVVTGAGLTMPDVSTAYAASQTKLHSQVPDYSRLGKLAATLIAGSTNGLDSGLKSLGIDYVLVPEPLKDASVAAALDGLAQLEPVGTTQFGRLWRVKSSALKHDEAGWDWSLTKQIQVGVLTAFALLAIPTRRRARVVTTDESELDDFGNGQEGEGF